MALWKHMSCHFLNGILVLTLDLLGLSGNTTLYILTALMGKRGFQMKTAFETCLTVCSDSGNIPGETPFYLTDTSKLEDSDARFPCGSTSAPKLCFRILWKFWLACLCELSFLALFWTGYFEHGKHFAVSGGGWTALYFVNRDAVDLRVWLRAWFWPNAEAEVAEQFSQRGSFCLGMEEMSWGWGVEGGAHLRIWPCTVMSRPQALTCKSYIRWTFHSWGFARPLCVCLCWVRSDLIITCLCSLIISFLCCQK